MLENWKSDIPILPRGLAILLFILNIIVPPIGTFLLCCLGSELKPLQLGIGLLQLLLMPLVIGYIWSIWWGIVILDKSSEMREVIIVEQ